MNVSERFLFQPKDADEQCYFGDSGEGTAEDKNVPVCGALPTLEYEKGQGHGRTTVSPNGDEALGAVEHGNSREETRQLHCKEAKGD